MYTAGSFALGTLYSINNAFLRCPSNSLVSSIMPSPPKDKQKFCRYILHYYTYSDVSDIRECQSYRQNHL